MPRKHSTLFCRSVGNIEVNKLDHLPLINLPSNARTFLRGKPFRFPLGQAPVTCTLKMTIVMNDVFTITVI